MESRLQKYLNQDIDNPIYLFHGSPKVLSELHPSQSYDADGNKSTDKTKAKIIKTNYLK